MMIMMFNQMIGRLTPVDYDEDNQVMKVLKEMIDGTGHLDMSLVKKPIPIKPNLKLHPCQSVMPIYSVERGDVHLRLPR